ncbi:MAG TPA: hypothetical protein DCS30_02230, partial [Rhizobiales bacterium]|nr:hypothetical protein [Hyphomicrobiales bacterium]
MGSFGSSTLACWLAFVPIGVSAVTFVVMSSFSASGAVDVAGAVATVPAFTAEEVSDAAGALVSAT